jgi:hypothetical protein
MSPELEYVRNAVEHTTRDWQANTWRQAPPGKWCCAEILEHLMLSYSGTTKGLTNAMRSGRPLGSKTMLPDRIKAFVVTKLGILPAGRKASRTAMPNGGLDMQSIRHFYDALVAMDATLTDAERRFGKSAKLLDHPSLGPLTAKEWRQFHQVHSNLHLKQMAALAQRVGYVSPEQQSAG